MQYRKKLFAILILFIACEKQPTITEILLNEYIQAANAHDIEKVYGMYSDSIVWHFGSFRFKGKEKAIAPLKFDTGANTVLVISNVVLNSDTVDFDLLETNDVITALGIERLNHFPRFIIKDGLILKKLSRKPPLEFKAFADSVSAFANWLRSNSPDIYEKIWPGDEFNFSEETGRIMPVEVRKWRNRHIR
jgi:hypothetical protein